MNDELVKSRMSQVSELRSDVTDKLNQTIKEMELVRMSSQQIEYAQEKLNSLKVSPEFNKFEIYSFF